MTGFMCGICYLRLPTLQILRNHYITKHSKLALAREILKLAIANTVPKVFAKKRKRKIKTTETVFVDDSFQICCRENEIIIKDDKSSVDLEFSFDENSSETKENDYQSQINNNNNNNNNKEFEIITSSNSVSSEENSRKFTTLRKRQRKKRDGKTKHYKVKLTRTKACESLNEITGKFYECHCRCDTKENTFTELKLGSDTESASGTSPLIFNDSKVFCSKCGNGYKDENLLREHMKIHETHCRVCNEIFPTEKLFKEHIQCHMFKVFMCHYCHFETPIKALLIQHSDSHIENSILDSVIDMEADYNVVPQVLTRPSYQESIANILCYLNDTSYETKVHCDICLCDMFFEEYENHMQNVHCIYGSL
ncbi:hypothetical protein ABEB36_009956 [Hypothenemus hampei]|uniref:C2H2-type domain-containing protein n=1 Tax=Hypothenemus hampei TaxID=57062 RepID=A0ABD1EM57_HYPHA